MPPPLPPTAPPLPEHEDVRSCSPFCCFPLRVKHPTACFTQINAELEAAYARIAELEGVEARLAAANARIVELEAALHEALPNQRGSLGRSVSMNSAPLSPPLAGAGSSMTPFAKSMRSL